MSVITALFNLPQCYDSVARVSSHLLIELSFNRRERPGQLITPNSSIIYLSLYSTGRLGASTINPREFPKAKNLVSRTSLDNNIGFIQLPSFFLASHVDLGWCWLWSLGQERADKRKKSFSRKYIRICIPHRWFL